MKSQELLLIRILLDLKFITKEGEKMKINSVRFDVAMATACITMSELSKKTNLNYSTLTRIKKGVQDARPATIGKIARALNVKVEDLVE